MAADPFRPYTALLYKNFPLTEAKCPSKNEIRLRWSSCILHNDISALPSPLSILIWYSLNHFHSSLHRIARYGIYEHSLSTLGWYVDDVPSERLLLLAYHLSIGRGRYGKKYGNSLEGRERDEPMKREGLQARGSYKEVPRPGRGLALAATKRSYLYQLNSIGESCLGARNTYSIICLFRR